MAYPSSFLRCTLRWQLNGGEVANTSYSMKPSTPLVSLDDATVNALAARNDAFWAAIAGRYASSTLYIGSSVSWVGVDGRTIMRQDRPISPSGGSDGASVLPNEVAWVISLRTATAGRRTRGRMYLPNPSTGQVNSQGRYNPDRCLTIANAAATLLGSLVVGAETFTSVVASATGSLFSPVTQVAVGDVPDVQRRRRDRLIEAYTTHAVA